jgi:hypothetical protein
MSKKNAQAITFFSNKYNVYSFSQQNIDSNKSKPEILDILDIRRFIESKENFLPKKYYRIV